MQSSCDKWLLHSDSDQGCASCDPDPTARLPSAHVGPPRSIPPPHSPPSHAMYSVHLYSPMYSILIPTRARSHRNESAAIRPRGRWRGRKMLGWQDGLPGPVRRRPQRQCLAWPFLCRSGPQWRQARAKCRCSRKHHDSIHEPARPSKQVEFDVPRGWSCPEALAPEHEA